MKASPIIIKTELNSLPLAVDLARGIKGDIQIEIPEEGVVLKHIVIDGREMFCRIECREVVKVLKASPEKVKEEIEDVCR